MAKQLQHAESESGGTAGLAIQRDRPYFVLGAEMNWINEKCVIVESAIDRLRRSGGGPIDHDFP